jgi:predicted dehydrogenase
MRRLFASFREIQRLASTGQLGEIREIRFELGEPFDWPAATDTYFGAKSGGHGVLFDTGAHVVDLVCWWMGGEPEVIEYADDSYGGTEAVARLTLRYRHTMAHVHLSWLSKLRNMYRVVGSRAVVEGGVYEWSSYTRIDAGGKARKIRTDNASRQLLHFPEMQIANFANVAAGRANPLVSAADVRASIAVISACYARRTRMSEPWHDACRRLAHAD